MNARYVPLPPRRALGTYWHMGMGRCGSGQETTPSSPYGELLSHASHATGSSYPACGEFISQDTPTRAICDMTDMRYDHEGRTRWGMLSLSPLFLLSWGTSWGWARGGCPSGGGEVDTEERSVPWKGHEHDHTAHHRGAQAGSSSPHRSMARTTSWASMTRSTWRGHAWRAGYGIGAWSSGGTVRFDWRRRSGWTPRCSYWRW